MSGSGTDDVPTDEEFEALTPDQVDAYARAYLNVQAKHYLSIDIEDLRRRQHLLLRPLTRNPVLDAALAVNKARGLKR